MNSTIKNASHPSIVFYDGDYPSKEHNPYPENFDAMVLHQGIADDINKYKEVVDQYGKSVLELCCGTGRISIPLALHGCTVTAVDISTPLLKQLERKVNAITDFPMNKLTWKKQDVTKLSFLNQQYDVVICAFNSLLCISDRTLQQETLDRAAQHLRPNGILALDIWNPLIMNLDGDVIPEPYYTRKNPHNGNQYTRFAGTGAMDINQVQPLFGWYEELQLDGSIKRIPYEMEWRLIFRYEIELMLEKAGFTIKNIYGGNNNEPLIRTSLKMFIEAIKL